MDEILTGILSGADYATHVKHWSRGRSGPSNLGQVFIALDPNCFAPGFEDRLTDMNAILRNLPPVTNIDFEQRVSEAKLDFRIFFPVGG